MRHDSCWHLFHNLSEALIGGLVPHHRVLVEAARAPSIKLEAPVTVAFSLPSPCSPTDVWIVTRPPAVLIAIARGCSFKDRTTTWSEREAHIPIGTSINVEGGVSLDRILCRHRIAEYPERHVNRKRSGSTASIRDPHITCTKSWL